MAPEAVPLEWQLSSSNGYVRLVCVLEPVADVPFAHRVHLEYELPGQVESVAKAEIPMLAVSRSRLRDFVAIVDAFVSQPLDALRSQHFSHTVELAESSADVLHIEFGPRRDVVTGTDGIACMIEIGSSAFTAHVSFRTDLTCLQILADQVELALAATESA